MPKPNHMRITVQTPGIAQRIAEVPTPTARLVIQALRANTGYVAIGGSSVRVEDGAQNAISLAGGTQPNIEDWSGYDLFDLYVDATVAGEGVAIRWEDA